MEPIISVIVPAWNSEAYLERCLDSIERQTFVDFEAIIVDASSTDATTEIAKRYCGRDSRFVLIKCGKRPPGIVRNYGTERARAPYIAFADSDDRIEPDMLERLYRRSLDAGADITVCDFNMVYPDKTIAGFSCMEDYRANLNEGNLADYYFRFNSAPKPNNYVWSRLYRKEFLLKAGIVFTDSNYSEDHTFNLMLLCKFPSVAHVGAPLYNYIQHGDSEVRRNVRNVNHGALFLRAFNLVRKYLERQNRLYAEPILSIYSYTRIKSIIFYAGQAGLSEAQTHKAMESFMADKHVRYYLGQCADMGYLRKYGDIHGLPEDWDGKARELIRDCLSGNFTNSTL